MKPPGRGPDIEGRALVDVDREVLEAVGEFHAASADEGMVGLREPDVGGSGHPCAGFRDHRRVDCHPTGDCQGARTLARLGQASVYEQDVESLLLCSAHRTLRTFER